MRLCTSLIVASSSAWLLPATRPPAARRATENDDDEDSSPLAWLRTKRDDFEPKWSWLKDKRDLSDLIREGRRADSEQLVRGQRAIEQSISRLAAAGTAGELLGFLEGEVRKERAVRNATLIFLADEWAREEALRRDTRAREEALRESALRFVGEEWVREEELRRDARAFVADESEPVWKSTSELDYPEKYRGDLREPPRHRSDVVMETTSRRWRGAPEIDLYAGSSGSPTMTRSWPRGSAARRRSRSVPRPSPAGRLMASWSTTASRGLPRARRSLAGPRRSCAAY